ncbi:MAG: NUDIX domain-containing protein [Candidatus Heimdallarchaeota archaeon]|nr:NUDIX domain-containing protein [Candidatus Heimdallarchaeota archaeon]
MDGRLLRSMYLQATIGVAMIILRDDLILLGKRSEDKEFGANLWEIPAGRVEKGETLENALQRELKEELNVELTGSKLIDAYTFVRKDNMMLLLSYICNFQGNISKSQEHKELRWVSLEQAKQLFSFDRQKQTIELLISRLEK